MNAKSETLLKVEDVLDWTYPIRKKGKNYDFVSFRAKDPVTKQLKEKRFSLKQYKKGVVRDTMAAQMIAKILNRLQQNWNPFVPDMEDRSSTLLSKVIMIIRIRTTKQLTIKADEIRQPSLHL